MVNKREIRKKYKKQFKRVAQKGIPLEDIFPDKEEKKELVAYFKEEYKRLTEKKEITIKAEEWLQGKHTRSQK